MCEHCPALNVWALSIKCEHCPECVSTALNVCKVRGRADFSNLQCCQGSSLFDLLIVMFNCWGFFFFNVHMGPSLLPLAEKARRPIHYHRIRGEFFFPRSFQFTSTSHSHTYYFPSLSHIHTYTQMHAYACTHKDMQEIIHFRLNNRQEHF